MKSGEIFTIIILLAIIIAISIWISQASTIKPYSPSKYTAYEGYQNIDFADVNSNTDMNTSSDSSSDSFTNTSNSQKISSKCVQLNGWNGYGVFCTPDGGLEKIDIYSQAGGNLSCSNNSSGYHNSKGGLCLDDNMKHLLQTRGQNATGGYSQIGSDSA